MWKNFEGKARTRDESAAHLAALKWTAWKPQGITLHNTAAPTLKQWAESGPAHDARIRNLESYYENQLGWHAGPHFFVSRNWINWFSNPLLPGVHSRCWNATRFGIEMVGDYNAEPFNSGDGALVRDNAVFLIAALNRKFGFKADGLTFHVECKRDNHDCPGRNVVKADVIARVKAEMARQAGQVAPSASPAPVAGRQTGIIMTEFAGPGEKVNDTINGYTGKRIDWKSPGVALPFHFPAPRQRVRVWLGGKSVVCDIVDIGPWYSHVGPNPYWQDGSRPKAESNKSTNGAGIDATPAVFDALGRPGAGKLTVDWEFVT